MSYIVGPFSKIRPLPINIQIFGDFNVSFYKCTLTCKKTPYSCIKKIYKFHNLLTFCNSLHG